MPHAEDDSFNFWPGYSDLALAAVFILMLFLLSQALFSSRLLVTEDLERVRVLRRQEVVREQLGIADGVEHVTVNGNLQIITLSADFLFASDDAQLTSSGSALLRQMAAVLLENERHFTRIAVEGHADFRPSRRYRQVHDLSSDAGNWRLSSERAIRVVQLMQAAGVPGERLEAVARSGYAPRDTTYRRYTGSSTPLDVAEYEKSLHANRRIVIRLFYSERAGVSE